MSSDIVIILIIQLYFKTCLKKTLKTHFEDLNLEQSFSLDKKYMKST